MLSVRSLSAAAHRPHLAEDARLGDGHFAGFVDHAVDQLGAHSEQRTRGAGIGRDRFRRFRRRLIRWRVRGSRRDERAAVQGCVQAAAVQRRVQSAPVQGHLERRHGQRRAVVSRRIGGRRRAALQLLDQQGDAVEGGLELLEQTVGDAAELADVDHACLHRVGQLADRHGADHPRAALERVQQALERLGDEPAGWIGAPVAQISADLGNQLRGFLQEHRQQRLVDVVGDAVLAPLDLHARVGCGVVRRAEQIWDRQADGRQLGDRYSTRVFRFGSRAPLFHQLGDQLQLGHELGLRLRNLHRAHCRHHRFQGGDRSAQRIQRCRHLVTRQQLDQALQRRRQGAHVAEAGGPGYPGQRMDVPLEIGRDTTLGRGGKLGEEPLDAGQPLRRFGEIGGVERGREPDRADLHRVFHGGLGRLRREARPRVSLRRLSGGARLPRFDFPAFEALGPLHQRVRANVRARRALELVDTFRPGRHRPPAGNPPVPRSPGDSAAPSRSAGARRTTPLRPGGSG